MQLFSGATQPGFAGYFGPTSLTGGKALIGFGSGDTGIDDARAAAQGSANWGFLTEQYQVEFGRNVQVKHFLNVDMPAAIAGYAQGTLNLSGLVGTYDGFKHIINQGTGDLCNRLVCVIQNGSGFTPCPNVTEAGSGEGAGTEIICHGLICSVIRITGSVQQDGQLFQQATIQFTLTGVEIEPNAVG